MKKKIKLIDMKTDEEVKGVAGPGSYKIEMRDWDTCLFFNGEDKKDKKIKNRETKYIDPALFLLIMKEIKGIKEDIEKIILILKDINKEINQKNDKM